MKNTKLTSILLASTVICTLALAPMAHATDSDGLKNIINQIRTNDFAGTDGTYTYTIPAGTSTNPVVETIWFPETQNLDKNMIWNIASPDKLTVNGDDSNQVIRGTLAVYDTVSGKTGKGSLTINNVGSFSQNITDYKDITTSNIQGHIENLSSYLSGTAYSNPDTPAVYVKNADLNVDGSTFYNSDTSNAGNISENGAAIYIATEGTSLTGDNRSTAKIQDSTFAFNKTNDTGAAINTSNAIVDIDGSTFVSNTATNGHGGAIDLHGKGTIDGSSFYQNSSKIGGAVFVHDNTTLASTNNTYDSNTSTGVENGSNGGAIQNSGTLTSTGDTFAKNSSDNGGAIAQTATSYTYTDNTGEQTKTFPAGTMTVENGIFIENTATTGGGAIYNDGTATIKGTTAFNSNTATAQGGAINNTKNLIIEGKNVTFTGNTAGNGGAIVNLTENASINSAGATFTENKATAGSGGAIYNATGATYTSNGDKFESNTAKTHGGAVYNVGSYTASGATTFTGNVAEYHGGAVYNTGTFTSTGTTYSGNIAGNAKVDNGSGGAIHNAKNATYISNGDKFENNNANMYGGAIYNEGTFTLNNAYNSSFSGNTNNATDISSSAIYNAGTGVFNINNASDTIDLDYWTGYNEDTDRDTFSNYTDKRLFADGQTIRNVGILNINNSDLQLHQKSDLTKGVINVDGDKYGTINLDDSRIDIGKSTLYTDSITFKNASELLTHVNAKSGTSFGKVATNSVDFDNTNNTLTIFVAAGEHLAKGQEKTFEIIASEGTHTGDFKTITDNKMYTITALGDGKYKLSRPDDTPVNPGPGPVTPPDDPDTTICPDAGCIHNAWVEHSKIEGHDKAEQIQNTLNIKAQQLGCDSEEYQRALSGVAPDVSPLIQAHSTEITRRLAGVISKQLYSSMERTGYIHRGKRFYKFPRRQSHLWVQGLYGQSEFDSKKGFDMDTQGIALGFDGHISPDTRLGLAYSYTTADGTAVERDTDVTSHTISVYGEYNPDRFYANWLALYTRSNYEEEKKVFNHRIKADYDVDVFGAQFMLGNKMGPFVVGDWASGVISPEVGLRYTYIKQHGYTDDAGQKVGAADGQILTGILGAQYTIGYTLAPGLAWYPELRAALTYDFIEPDMENSVTLVNGARYDVVTENLDKFGIEIGARVGLDINRKTEVALEYEGLFKGDYTNHTGLASLKYKF